MNQNTVFYRCTYSARCPLAQKFRRSDPRTWIRILPNRLPEPECPLKDERPQCRDELEPFNAPQSNRVLRYLGLMVMVALLLAVLYLGLAAWQDWPPFENDSIQQIQQHLRDAGIPTKSP